MVKNTQVVFSKVPEKYPVIGEHMTVNETEIDLDAEIPQGSILVKTLVLSVDPYMRGRMRDASVKSYSPAFALDQPMNSHVMALVLKSNNDRFAEGDLVYGLGSHQNYVVVPEPYTKLLEVRNEAKDSGIPLSNYVGVLGMPGNTAYTGLIKFGKPKAGETLYVSAASGAVGQLVGQIGKNLGLHVVGSAGSDEKVAYLKEIGFDSAFNYKTRDAEEALGELCPNGIDIYFENVGGKMLEAVINHSNRFARIVCCGMISQYNVGAGNQEPIHNLIQVVAKSLVLQGFIVSDYPDMVEPFRKEVTEWLKSGKIQYRETIATGIENTPEAMLDVLTGKNFGKQVVKVADL
ncbi:NAD(P)-binding protein [Backusella circina FSU 941]|nr:NAD(P)-binding protein [Backusella circina FSU 941]